MDVPPVAGFEPSSEHQAVEPTMAEVVRRLDAVEAGMGRLGGRLEALAVSLEASFETAVATEVQAAAAELRHTVSELGRILVRDLGKLPQMLTKHRQAIVAELRATDGSDPGPSGPLSGDPGPSGPLSGMPAEPSATLAAEVVGDGELDEVDDSQDHDPGRADEAMDADDSGDSAGGDRNWRGHLRRHRQG